MRVLLQDVQTNWFYRGQESWTPDAAEAFDFQRCAGRREFLEKLELPHSRLIISFLPPPPAEADVSRSAAK